MVWIKTISVQDADADGVPDPLDKCPNTPAGAQVDDGGCSKAEFCASVSSGCDPK